MGGYAMYMLKIWDWSLNSKVWSLFVNPLNLILGLDTSENRVSATRWKLT